MSRSSPSSNAHAPRPEPLLVLSLAWLVPGAGHWLLGRRRRAISYTLAVLSTFVLGLIMSAGHVVSRTEHPTAFWLQLPCGAPTLIASALSPTNEDAASARAASPRSRRELLLQSAPRPVRPVIPPDGVVAVMDLALTFTMAAGLLNLLLLHDAWETAVLRRRGTP